MKEMWDKKAESYTRFTGELSEFQKIFFAKLKELGVEFEGKSLIDVGCGTGVHTLYLAGLCSRVTGVDSSEGMLKVMREDAKKFGIKNLSVVQSDFESFNSFERYDIAFCTMSPAISGKDEFSKFISLGDERVRLWWHKPRFSSVLNRFYEIFGSKNKSPKPDGLEEFLLERKIEFKSCILNEERLAVRSLDEAAQNVSWHLRMDGLPADETFIRNELLKLERNGAIEEKILSSMKLSVF